MNGAVIANAILGGLVWCGAGAASGAEPDFERAVRDLGAADYQVREWAGKEISNDKRVTLEQLEEALRRADLSAEQRHRLGDAAFGKFMTAPHGALGVEFDTSQADKVLIDKVSPGFPAAAVLRPMDVLLEVAGTPVQPRAGMVGATSVRPVVISHTPGDVIDMKVRRDGKVVDLRVTLGDFRDLRQGYMPQPQELADAWRVRQRRTVGAVGGVPAIDAPVTTEQALGDGLTLRGHEATVRQRARVGLAPSVVPGGRPDPARQADLAMAGSDAAGMQMFAGNQFLPGGVRLIGPGGRMAADLSGERLESLQRQRTLLQARRMDYSLIITDPAIDQATAAQFKQLIADTDRHCRLIESEIRRREAQGQPVAPPVKDPR